jgi:peptidoglycan/xylan/chitin deacetylase (PgdA/CDA1 family)
MSAGHEGVTQMSIALTFHTERIYDERVWQRLQRVAKWMAAAGRKATFFVYPFRGQVLGRDMTDRVRMLAAMGHEIGQHTHFYAGTKVNKPDKLNDLSDANITSCLYRDFETLQRMGFPPKGFTAGAWLVNGTVLNTLVELGFVYDCSACFPKPREMVHSPYRQWLRSPQRYTNVQGDLLCLPTTCSLGEWFKWGRKLELESKVPYKLVYLHDYDLLLFRNNLLLWIFMYMTTSGNFQPANAISKQFLL